MRVRLEASVEPGLLTLSTATQRAIGTCRNITQFRQIIGSPKQIVIHRRPHVN